MSATRPGPARFITSARPTAPAPTPPGGGLATTAQNPVAQLPLISGASTPSQLVRWMLLAIAALLAFGVGSALWMTSAANSLDRAGDNATQLVRIQAIQSQLLRADALATNAFLVGGQETVEQRAEYDQAISEADHLIIAAAQAQSADQTALADLNDEIVGYVGTMEQARAANRQGFPVGAAYLASASKDLRADAMPILDELVDANQDRVTQETRSVNYWLPLVLGLLAIVALVLAGRWHSRRFRRTLNPGLVLATAAVVLALVAGILGTMWASAGILETRLGSLRNSVSAAIASTAIYDAKASESLTLVARGSGAPYENAWQGSFQGATLAVAEVSSGQDVLEDRLADYAAVHGKIRELDGSGDWDGAVALATSDAKTADSSNAAVAAFESAALALVQDQAAVAADELRGFRAPLLGVGFGSLILALAGAFAASWGLNKRLKEYR